MINGGQKLHKVQEQMIATLHQMEQMIRQGQIAHVCVIGVQAGGAHAFNSVGMPGVVSEQAIIGALELSKGALTRSVLNAHEKPSRIVQARPLNPAFQRTQ